MSVNNSCIISIQCFKSIIFSSITVCYPDTGPLHRAAAPHNSDLRDFHEYLQKEVWGAQNCTRQSSRRFGLERTRLTEASVAVCFDSAHTTYFETICVLYYVAQIWVVPALMHSVMTHVTPHQAPVPRVQTSPDGDQTSDDSHHNFSNSVSCCFHESPRAWNCSRRSAIWLQTLLVQMIITMFW